MAVAIEKVNQMKIMKSKEPLIIKTLFLNELSNEVTIKYSRTHSLSNSNLF